MTDSHERDEVQQQCPKSDDDGCLIRAAADGDRDAFERLVCKYERFVYRIAFLASGNTADAEDLTQEIFLRLWRGLSGFRGQSHALTWLARIARNTCADHIRKKQRTVPLESLSLIQEDDGETVERDLQDNDPQNDPQSAAVRGEEARLVRQAMEMLSEEHRTLILLRDIEGHSYEMLARELGLEEGTVKSRLFRARAQLKRALVSLGMFDESKAIPHNSRHMP